MDNKRLTMKQRQYTLLRACTHAGTASDTLVQINLRMQQPRLVAAVLAGYCTFAMASSGIISLPHSGEQ